VLPSARLYACARCRCQVLICRCCDRGQRYCTRGCAREARQHRQREAAARYAASPHGRLKHAARARRYRSRWRNKVTHQGSLAWRADASIARMRPVTTVFLPVMEPDHCHFCGGECDPRVRQWYLGRDRWGSGP
jgi:hypothetical protein